MNKQSLVVTLVLAPGFLIQNHDGDSAIVIVCLCFPRGAATIGYADYYVILCGFVMSGRRVVCY